MVFPADRRPPPSGGRPRQRARAERWRQQTQRYTPPSREDPLQQQNVYSLPQQDDPLPRQDDYAPPLRDEPPRDTPQRQARLEALREQRARLDQQERELQAQVQRDQFWDSAPALSAKPEGDAAPPSKRQQQTKQYIYIYIYMFAMML